ncbi:MAG: HDOD domain-containing protein, partial [Phycisphaeraceae bacterium]
GEDILPAQFCFDHVAFWRHSLAVAVAAERIAAAHPGDQTMRPADAFVCGLVHDIGKLALERVLPKSYQRVIELVEINQGNIAQFERRIVGMDHHTAGKRLAEQWELPHLIQDCIWLHGSSYETVPPLPHRRMIGLIALADLIARQQHVGFSGNLSFRQQVAPLVEQLSLDQAKVDDVTHDLHELVAARAAALGLDDTPSQGSFLRAIQQANEMLGRLNSALARRSQLCTRQQQVLETIAAFHNSATPGRSVEDVITTVIDSAIGVLGSGYYGVVYPLASRRQWQINAYHEGRVVGSHVIDPPPGAPDLSTLDPNHPAMLNQMGILPWLADYLGNEVDVRQVRMLPLGCGWGTAAILLHDRPVLPAWQLLSAVTNTWGAAIAAAAQHEGARRLGEQLADANHALAEAQDRLLRNESMARLGEMAGGAAHEMNNPLAVISGRSQLLAQSLPVNSDEQKAAQTIVAQAHRLSDLITSLRLYADPPKATRRPTDIAALLDDTVKRLSKGLPRNLHCPINLQVRKEMPTVWVDGEQIRLIILELLTNAIQASPRTGVHLSARIDPVRSALVIQVTDDGSGMDAHTLAHAMDPFFSARAAGRGVGMGLPRAGQFAAAHDGSIELRSTAGEGTLATVILPLDSHR